MNYVEQPLDPPEAWGCEYCNPESLGKEEEILPCGQPCPVPSPVKRDSDYFTACNRPEGHDDEHAFCTFSRHPLKTWR